MIRQSLGKNKVPAYNGSKEPTEDQDILLQILMHS